MHRHNHTNNGNGHCPRDPKHDHNTHDNGKGNNCGPVNPCLLSGTWISLPGGRQRLIEELSVGDRVSVMRGGSAEIIHIAKNTYTAKEVDQRPELRPWMFNPDGLHSNTEDPSDPVMVSKWHRLAMPAWSPETPDGVLIAAVHLEKTRPDLCRQWAWAGPITWYNIYTEEHEVIAADGISVETGWLGGDMAPRLLGEDWSRLSHLAEAHRLRPALPFVSQLPKAREVA